MSPIAFKSVLISVAAAVCIAVLTGIVVALRPTTGGGDVPLFETPAWQGKDLAYGDQLMLRRVAPGAGALLLKHTRGTTVYRYDPTARTLTPVGDEEWRRALGAVAECGQQFAPPPQVLALDPKSDKLLAGGRVVPTAGRLALKVIASPSGKWVAVLSADGSKGSSLMPFTGGGGASGQHYHQVVSLPGGTPANGTVRVPLRQRYDLLTPCWSADEAFVVYHHITFNYLSIIDTNLSLPLNSQKVP